MQTIEDRVTAALCERARRGGHGVGRLPRRRYHTADSDYDLAFYFGPGLDLDALARCFIAWTTLTAPAC